MAWQTPCAPSVRMVSIPNDTPSSPHTQRWARHWVLGRHIPAQHTGQWRDARRQVLSSHISLACCPALPTSIIAKKGNGDSRPAGAVLWGVRGQQVASWRLCPAGPGPAESHRAAQCPAGPLGREAGEGGSQRRVPSSTGPSQATPGAGQRACWTAVTRTRKQDCKGPQGRQRAQMCPALRPRGHAVWGTRPV